jgi:hypothetical protein
MLLAHYNNNNNNNRRLQVPKPELITLVPTTMAVAYCIGLKGVAKVVDEEAGIALRAMTLKTPKNLRNTTARVIMMETIIIAFWMLTDVTHYLQEPQQQQSHPYRSTP